MPWCGDALSGILRDAMIRPGTPTQPIDGHPYEAWRLDARGTPSFVGWAREERDCRQYLAASRAFIVAMDGAVIAASVALTSSDRARLVGAIQRTHAARRSGAQGFKFERRVPVDPPRRPVPSPEPSASELAEDDDEDGPFWSLVEPPRASRREASAPRPAPPSRAPSPKPKPSLRFGRTLPVSTAAITAALGALCEAPMKRADLEPRILGRGAWKPLMRDLLASGRVTRMGKTRALVYAITDKGRAWLREQREAAPNFSAHRHHG